MYYNSIFTFLGTTGPRNCDLEVANVSKIEGTRHTKDHLQGGLPVSGIVPSLKCQGQGFIFENL